KKLWPMINDQAWLESQFIPTVQKRGAAIIDARGLSSAASAANAAIDHVRDWVVAGSKDGDWVTMGVPSDGSYAIPEGGIYGYPATLRGASIRWSVESRSANSAGSAWTPRSRSSTKSATASGTCSANEPGLALQTGTQGRETAAGRRYHLRLPRTDGEARRL